MVVSSFPVSCSVVGDGMVGKSSLIQSLLHREPSKGYMATVVERYHELVSAYGDEYLVNITDFGGEHHNDVFRGSSITRREVFVVCYSVTDRESFTSAREFWVPAIRKLSKRHSIILVATHLDLRQADDSNHVTFEEGSELCKEVRGHAFVECSATDNVRTPKVFQSVVSTAIAQKKRKLSAFRRIIGR